MDEGGGDHPSLAVARDSFRRMSKKSGGSIMSRLSRRRFLTNSIAAAGAGVLINGTKATGNFFGANETIRVGVAGINGRGGSHIDAYGKMQDVRWSI